MTTPLDPSPSTSQSVQHGRILIVLAAVLWSLSSGFTKTLTKNTPLGLNTPHLDNLVIAMGRVLFAGLILTPTLRRCDVSFRPMMLVMIACFGGMNALYVTAMSKGTAANAVFLQYTAPLWMYVVSVLWLGEKADKRSLAAVIIGTLGIWVILAGGWQGDEDLGVLAMGLGSGMGYAGVMICLRVLRNVSARWLTVLNHLFGGLALIPFLGHFPTVTLAQFGFLIVFGTVQMAIPYWLVARGLRSVSAQEAGAITLLEPILNPIWAYLVVAEVPSLATLIGGGFILGALIWRYWPFAKARVS